MLKCKEEEENDRERSAAAGNQIAAATAGNQIETKSQCKMQL